MEQQSSLLALLNGTPILTVCSYTKYVEHRSSLLAILNVTPILTVTVALLNGTPILTVAILNM